MRYRVSDLSGIGYEGNIVTSPRILISTPTNGQAPQVYEQALAYSVAMNGNCVQIVHVSRDAQQKRAMEHCGGQSLGDLSNVYVNDRSYFSRTPSIMGIHIMNVEFALRKGIAFDYVYLHTASDLPFRRDLDKHIAGHDLGLAPSRIVDTSKETGWNPAVADHRAINELVSFFGPGAAIYTIRSEGFFCRRDLFFEIMSYAMIHVPFERESIWRGNYPYEEYVLPTVVEHVLAGRNLRRTRHAVITTTSDQSFGLATRERLSERHIGLLDASGADIYAFKFAPAEIDSPVRKWVREQLGYALTRD